MKPQLKTGLLMLALACLLPATAAAAPQTGNATTYTYTLDAENNWTRTQDAYLTGEVLFLDDPLSAPEDIAVRDGMLYIADTGAGRVVRYNLQTGETAELGLGILAGPTGIHITPDGRIYAADPQRETVTELAAQGEPVREYGRPHTTAFGERSIYKPRKVSVDGSGVLSIVSDGAYDGVVQLTADGDFLGYFGYNAVPMSVLELFQNRFFTEAQKAQLFNKLPLSFYNLAIDSLGILYTITQGTETGAVKKHNVTGIDLLPPGTPCEKNFTDIAVGPDGQILAITETGLIYEYDNDGALLLSFGGRAAASERSGLVTLASGIAVDDYGNLYVLDKERGLIHTYLPTAFADRLHGAVRQYRDGDYAGSHAELTALLGQVGNVRMVYDYLGMNALQLREYDDAAIYFRSAGNRSGYSEALWELRNRSMTVVLPIGLGLIAVIAVLHLIVRRRRRSAAVSATAPVKKSTGRVISDLRFSLQFIRHPFNSFYEVQTGRRGNVVTALCLYLLAFLTFAADTLLRGFTYSARTLDNTSPLYVVMLFALPLGLFILSSYMISEINNGKGCFRIMLIGMAYTLTPLICILPPLTLLTHVLTMNETFLVSLGTLIAYAWTGALLVIALRELHEYEYRQAFSNIVLSLFLMVVIIFVCSVIGMFWNRVAEIVSSIGREVRYRAGF